MSRGMSVQCYPLPQLEVHEVVPHLDHLTFNVLGVPPKIRNHSSPLLSATAAGCPNGAKKGVGATDGSPHLPAGSPAGDRTSSHCRTSLGCAVERP